MSSLRDTVARGLLASKTGTLTDMLAAAALAAGVAEAVYLFRGLEATPGLTLLVALAICASVALLSQRWWLAPLLTGIPLLTLVLIVWRLDLMPAAWQSLADFGRWGQSWLLYGLAEAPVAGWPSLLKLLLLAPAAIFFQLLVRHRAILPVGAALLAILFTPLLIWYPDALPNLLLSLGGLIILLPRRFVRLIHRENPQEPELPRAPMQLLAVPVAIICLLLAQAVIPISTHNWRLPVIVNQINDWQDLWQSNFGTPRAWQAFNLAEFGFQPDGSRLGGPVTLDDRTILTVRADQPVLLRGVSRSVYTGSSWQRPGNPQYRFTSSLWAQARQQVFDGTLPGGQTGRAFLARYCHSSTLRIESPYRLSTLFAAGRVQDIQYEDRFNNPPYFTTTGDLFVYQALPIYTTYTIETEYLDQRQDGFDQALLALEATAARSGDKSWLSVCHTYLQLPASLPAEVAEAARTAVNVDSSPYQQALELVQYFKTSFTYTLQPDMPPAHTDFVAYFLQTKRGYCVYFASAMTVMARTLGIPARYVEGFTLTAAESTVYDASRWEATGDTAHAWVELYFQGIGWLSFDPTPGSSDANPDGTAEPEPTIIPESTSSKPEPTTAPDTGNNGGTNRNAAWYWLLLLPVVFVLGARLLLKVLQRRHTLRFQPEKVLKRLPEPTSRLEFYYKDVLRQLDCLGIRPETGETLVDFAIRADRFLRLTDLTLPEVLWPVNRWRYGELPPAPIELARIAELRRHIEDRLRETMSRLSYLLRRVI